MERGRKWLERGRREGRVRKGEWRTMRGRTGGGKGKEGKGKGKVEGRREGELIPHHEILDPPLQTDGRADTGRQQRPRLRMGSRGKK